MARIETLRRLARESGLPELIIGGGTSGVGYLESGLAVAHFDYLTTYMDMPKVPDRDELYPYEDLFRHALRGWMRYALQSEKPYVPYVPSGWDPRPWNDPRPCFEMPTREEWSFALKRTVTALDKYRTLGIPTSDGGRQKLFTIYAWNEYGEGGYLAPTRGEGDMKLQVIKEVFGR